MRAKLRELKQQLRMHMHDPVPQTGGWLKLVVQGYFQLLRGTREPRELGRVPGPIAGAVVANSSSPEPATPPTVDPDACAESTMATFTAGAPSLPCSSLRRQSSEIRTGCANERGEMEQHDADAEDNQRPGLDQDAIAGRTSGPPGRVGLAVQVSRPIQIDRLVGNGQHGDGREHGETGTRRKTARCEKR